MTTEVRDVIADEQTRAPALELLDRRLEVIVTAIVTAPFVVAAIVMVTRYRNFAPFADIALIELGVRDVGRHLVLLGVYSRFGWRHPGPILFYVLAVPYWLTGGSTGGLLAGAALLNAACVVAIGWLAHRRGGRPLLLLTMLFVACLARTIGPELWSDPWNPSLAMLPMLVFVFGCWSLADGDDVVLPLLVITGTFCVQAHIGYAWFIAVPLAIAVVSRLVLGRTRRPSQRGDTDERHEDMTTGRPPSTGRLRRALLWSALIGAVLWLPPVLDQAIHRPGNARELVSFVRDTDPQYGLKDGLQFTRFELGPTPAWLFGEHEAGWLGLVDYSKPPIPIGGLLLAAATVLAVWRKDWSGTRLAVLAIALLGTSAFAVSRTVEGLFPYLVRWSPAVGLTAWLAISWIICCAMGARIGATGRRIAGSIALGLIAIVSVANIWAATTTPPHDADKSQQIQAFTAQLVPNLDKSKPVVVDTPDPTGGVEALYMLPAVALQLERQGFDIRVDDSRFTNRNTTGDERQVVSIHRVAPDAPTVPSLSSRPPTATQDDFIAWVTNR